MATKADKAEELREEKAEQKREDKAETKRLGKDQQEKNEQHRAFLKRFVEAK
jgi:hypothetical protein